MTQKAASAVKREAASAMTQEAGSAMTWMAGSAMTQAAASAMWYKPAYTGRLATHQKNERINELHHRGVPRGGILLKY